MQKTASKKGPAPEDAGPGWPTTGIFLGFLGRGHRGKIGEPGEKTVDFPQEGMAQIPQLRILTRQIGRVGGDPLPISVLVTAPERCRSNDEERFLTAPPLLGTIYRLLF